MFNPVIMRALATAATNGAVGALLRNRKPQRRGLNDWDEYDYSANGGSDGWAWAGYDAAYDNDYFYLSDPWGGFDPYSAQGADSLTGSQQGIWDWNWETGQYDAPAAADDSAFYPDTYDYSTGQYTPPADNFNQDYSYWDTTLWNTDDPNTYTFTDASGTVFSYDVSTGEVFPVDFTADLYAEGGDGLPILQIETTDTAPDVVVQPDNSINLSDLGNTLDWWQQLATDPGTAAEPTPISLPAVTYDAGYILNTPSATLASDPNAPPAIKAIPALKKPSAWDKIKAALAAQLQKAASGASGGGAPSASRPATTPPNAQGQCPTGYQKNPQTGQCQLIQRPAAQQRPATVAPNAQGQCPPGYAKNAQGQCVKQQGLSLQGFLSNPLYLLLAALGLILIAKK